MLQQENRLRTDFFLDDNLIDDARGDRSAARLFGAVVIRASGVFAELYCERLGELFPFVTPHPLIMMNNHNVPIFHFVCASFNQTAVKIAQQIIDKRQ